jgi:hypothetical protein
MIADLQGPVDAQPKGGLDALAIGARAVARLEIRDEDGVVTNLDPAVAPRDASIGQHEVCGRRAPDGQGPRAEPDALHGRGAFDDDEAMQELVVTRRRFRRHALRGVHSHGRAVPGRIRCGRCRGWAACAVLQLHRGG